ncbi:MAG: transcriptional regulator, IclR family [Ramlibacter sp.]|nr:transcriptional regulator, IclR family [Ramlibacter sp.]
MATTADGEATSSKYRVEALAKGLGLLTLFSEARQSLKLKEICELSGLPMPTAFRLLATLQEAGYVERLVDDSYRPGLQVLTLGHAALRSLDLLQCAEEPIRALAESTAETVNLAVLSGDRVLYVARRRNTDLVTANISVGSTLPAVLSSLGKVLLADLDDDAVTSLLGPTNFALAGGPNAITSSKQLLVQLREVRRAGFATQDEELARGLRSVAAPVRGSSSRTVAAVNIAVNAADYTLEELLRRHKDSVLATADEISLRLGRP